MVELIVSSSRKTIECTYLKVTNAKKIHVGPYSIKEVLLGLYHLCWHNSEHSRLARGSSQHSKTIFKNLINPAICKHAKNANHKHIVHYYNYSSYYTSITKN